jgi:DNA-binding NarL/FixJ family response regulator
MSSIAQIRVLSVDDHPLLREGLAAVIRSQPDLLLVAEAANGQEAIQRFREHMPDVTLMDLRLPDMSGIDAMIAIRSQLPEARIIILTTFANDVEIQRALEAGARSYLLKNMAPKQLTEVIRQVQAGKKPIPPEIAAHLAEHHSDVSITVPEIEQPTDTGESVEITENRHLHSSQGTLQRWVSRCLRRK